MPPSISFRKSIKWGDGEAQEPTTTLVLTTSSGHYIDVRLLLPDEFPINSKEYADNWDAFKLDWVFAGASSSSHEVFEGRQARRCTWTHWMDNLKPSGYQDSGVMWTQENGTTMEVGRMENPASGEIEKYEEVWEDPVPKCVGRYDGKRVCCAIKLDTEKAKGMVIRVGEWIQGILFEKEEEGWSVSVERMKWFSNMKGPGGFASLIKLGKGKVPIWLVLPVALEGDDEREKRWMETKGEWELIEYELF